MGLLTNTTLTRLNELHQLVNILQNYKQGEKLSKKVSITQHARLGSSCNFKSKNDIPKKNISKSRNFEDENFYQVLKPNDQFQIPNIKLVG